MRWITVFGGLALTLLTTAGCTQYLYITECDTDHYRNLMPAALECTPVSIQPPGPVYEQDPATIFSPSRPIRYLSLAECLAIALENGNVGEGNPNNLLSLGGVQPPGPGTDTTVKKTTTIDEDGDRKTTTEIRRD